LQFAAGTAAAFVAVVVSVFASPLSVMKYPDSADYFAKPAGEFALHTADLSSVALFAVFAVLAVLYAVLVV